MFPALKAGSGALAWGVENRRRRDRAEGSRTNLHRRFAGLPSKTASSAYLDEKATELLIVGGLLPAVALC
jgi:hypothetical protein